MKKIFIVAIILIIISGIYYFYFLADDETVSVATTEVELDVTTEKSKDNSNKTSIKKDNDKKAGKTETEKKEEIQIKETYPYRAEFRNPFKDYRVIKGVSKETIVSDPDILTINSLKDMLPFKLKGIIGNDKNRLAVIAYQNETKIIKDGTIIEEFNVVKILADRLIILYRGIQFEIEMGSDIGENI